MLVMYREEDDGSINEINCDKDQVKQLEEVGFSFSKPKVEAEED